MRLLSIFKKKPKQKARQKPIYPRSFAAANVNRLTADWAVSIQSADSALRYGLRTMRARSRELSQNNDYARRFLSSVKTNVVGAKGIRLQVRARDDSGELDKTANQLITDSWQEWGKKKNSPSVDGRLSWVDIQKLCMETIARDGEVLVRKVKGFPNRHRFALQVLEADHLDEDYTGTAPNGNLIKMGIEYDKWGRPVAYHLLTQHPGENIIFPPQRRAYERIPANEIIHAFILHRPSQSRGVPWMHSAMTRLNMLGGYEEAELVAARVGASKMGFFISPDGSSYTGETEEDGATIMEADPGTFEQLPEGMDFKAFDPQHPNSGFQAFEKAILRGVASGLGISYNSLANDLEGVNFSSIRHGTLEERDQWRDVQGWLAESLCDAVYSDWLEMALLTGAVKLPFAKFEKYNKPIWQPRGWMWIDPLKEHQANALAVASGMKTYSMVAAEQGQEAEEIFTQLAAEKAMAASLGLNLDTLPGKTPLPDTENQPTDEESHDEDE